MGGAGRTEIEARRPVVIIGLGRVGSTLLNRVLEGHPDLAWFSGYADRWPTHPQLAALNRLSGSAFLAGKLGDRRGFPPSAEAIHLWMRTSPTSTRTVRTGGSSTPRRRRWRASARSWTRPAGGRGGRAS